MDVSLADLAALSRDILSIADDRPDRLKKMPSAMDERQTQFGRYYRFFWEFAKRWSPARVCEIGTYKGSSIAHLALGNPDGFCVTIDIEYAAIQHAMELQLQNILAVHGDSAAVLENVAHHHPFDALFIDGNHTFNSCYGEYLHYRPLVTPGGIIFFDDIRVHPEMEVAWDCVADPKVELPELHWTGFGAAKVDPEVTPMSWQELAPQVPALVDAKAK